MRARTARNPGIRRRFGGGPVTAPLPYRKQLSVLRMFFEGMSYALIAQHARVGKGSVEEIIRRLKSGEYEEYQDVHDIIDVLRETATYIRKDFSGDLGRCHIGSLAWVSLNRLGVDPAKVPEWARMCEDLATSEVPVQQFVEIALWCRRLQHELGVDLRDLPDRLESFKGERDALQAEQQASRSDLQATKAALAPLREELRLSQDIQELRSAKGAEESRLAEVQSRTRSELAAAQVTSEGLEQFRVFAGTAKAKGVPIDGALVDTLLSLVASLGPQGILEADTLRRLLAKEGKSPADGATLLRGLWRMGFTLSRATDVARAIGNREPFPAALSRLVSALHHHGSLQAAVAASSGRQEELRKQEAAQRAESVAIERHLGYLRQELGALRDQVKEASAERERIRSETRKAVADCEARLQRLAEEGHRLMGMREACFDEFADRNTLDDYALLGDRMRNKASLGPAPALVAWIWELMSGREAPLPTPYIAADGTPLRGPDGAAFNEPVGVSLSRGDRRQLRELLHQASLEDEGPFHALARIFYEPVEGPSRPVDVKPDDNADLLDDLARRGAAIEFRAMVFEIGDGKRGHYTPLRSGTSIPMPA